MFEVRTTKRFNRKARKFKKNAEAKRKINESVEILKTNPYHNSMSLQGNYKGKRKNRKGDLRIVFAICEECRELGYTDINRCLDCDKHSDQTLMLFDVDSRPRAYRNN